MHTENIAQHYAGTALFSTVQEKTSFLGCEEDVACQHRCYTWNLLLAVHELLAGVGLKVVRNLLADTGHHGEKVHALPVVTKDVHQCLDEP